MWGVSKGELPHIGLYNLKGSESVGGRKQWREASKTH